MTDKQASWELQREREAEPEEGSSRCSLLGLGDGHTPGPLEAIGNLVRTDMGRGGFLVAEFFDANGQPHNPEAKANAALFIASGDLLNVAQMVLALANDHMPKELIDAASAAVSKISKIGKFAGSAP